MEVWVAYGVPRSVDSGTLERILNVTTGNQQVSPPQTKLKDHLGRCTTVDKDENCGAKEQLSCILKYWDRSRRIVQSFAK